MRLKILCLLTFILSSFAYADRMDPRYYFHDDFLFEHSQPLTGDGSLECVVDAINTFPLSAPYYSHYYAYDVKLIENIYPEKKIGVILFLQKLTDEARILPSDGDTSPLLFLDSLLYKMCRRVKTDHKYYIDYHKQKDHRIWDQIQQIKDYSDIYYPVQHYLWIQTTD